MLLIFISAYLINFEKYLMNQTFMLPYTNMKRKITVRKNLP